MMHKVVYSPRAQKDLRSLSSTLQKRILQKIQENASLDDPLVRAKLLLDLPPSTHRFRIGKYRVSFFIEDKVLYVQRIQLRDRAYR